MLLISMTKLLLPFTIQVLTCALELPPHSYLRQEWQALLCLLGPVMLASWGLSTLLVWGIMRVAPKEALAIAACVTPTDPLVIHSTVKGGSHMGSSSVPRPQLCDPALLEVVLGYCDPTCHKL